MITGGGGSIGSELSRQIASHDPKALILVDIYENNVYDIQMELREKYPNFEKAIKEAAIRNEFQLGLLSEDFNPVLQVETRHNTSLEKIVRYGREIASNIGDVYTLVNSNGTLIYWGRISVEDVSYYLFIVDNEDNYSAGEIRKLADIIEIAIGMWKYTPERDIKLEFLRALNRGNKSLAYQSAEEVQVNPEDMVSVFFGEGLDIQRCDEIIDKLLGM